ncbi:Translation initiation factor 3, N-terminal [Cynara cardunculus var. scolymus]|uniref:Translation initiation factor 3, N-terminal n=1 Tax=Cynara cardunculus var. scolymus TaxID=59895 RepID=A0A124SCF9_CYNCS|nr:Translation initiation factor 3, N-terminal [Cynara cardunculus var. scolymus]
MLSFKQPISLSHFNQNSSISALTSLIPSSHAVAASPAGTVILDKGIVGGLSRTVMMTTHPLISPILGQSTVRLIDEEQNMVGVASKTAAIQMAEDTELDLVCV